MKNHFLKVTYRLGDNGQLYVWICREVLHIGTVEVSKFDVMNVIRGANNKSPVFVRYLLKEPLNVEA